MSSRRTWRLLAVASALVVFAAACSDSDDSADTGGERDEVELAGDANALEAVIESGTLRCGTRPDLPGFALLTDEGEYEGFDADFCRAFAAGILGDAGAAEFVEVSTDDRFTALQAGNFDVMPRNTTENASRDGGLGADFIPVTFYDGQGMMVAADSEFESVGDMDGTTVCLVSGTTTQQNLEDKFTTEEIALEEALPFDDTELVQEAFIEGRCDGWTSDRSQLVSRRSVFPESEGGPEALRILDDVFSDEPLAPAVAQGSDKLLDALKWVRHGVVLAERFGITSANVDEMRESDDPNVQRLLGVETGDDAEIFDPGLGIPTDAIYQAVKQVGNYGEIFDKNITPLGLDRGVNRLWTDGGLVFAPPYK